MSMDSNSSTSGTTQHNDVVTNTPATATGAGPSQIQSSTTTDANPASLETIDDTVDIDLFAKVKLRVATIEGVEPVPKSKKLYKIQLDVGSLGKRQIVSGIAQHYSPEQLIGKQIVIIANLKPAKLMGVESQGMLLAASTEGDTTLALLTPDKSITAGSSVR